MTGDDHDATAGRRKRVRPEEHRKRAIRACEYCRKLKEKCQGGYPCDRCVRIGRTCEAVDHSRIFPGLGERSDRNKYLEIRRIKLLEQIVAHHTGISTFDIATLTSTSAALERPPIHIPRNDSIPNVLQGRNESQNENSGVNIDQSLAAPLDSSELSHSKFSTRVREKIDSRLQESLTVQRNLNEQESQLQAVLTPSHLHAEKSVVDDAAAFFPPPGVANFLLDVFVHYAQTNYSYVDEQLLRRKLRGYYTQTALLRISDAPWVCTTLMVFAVGTQFAHLSATAEKSDNVVDADPHAQDDETSLSFYHAACKLIPEAIAAASIDSVQAFLLLSVFTLPLDAAGISCTYLGIAIKIGTQNSLHRQCHRKFEPRQVELRKRIWWTAYTLERRICILHGRPVSILRTEVDQGLPTECEDFPTSSRHSLPNNVAMIKLTEALEEARDLLFALRRESQQSKLIGLQALVDLKQKLRQYWRSLPDVVHCRDLRKDNSLFRYNIHLALTYHLIHIFIGRSFIFEKSESQESPGSGIRETLVEECIQSALEVIDLCQKLDTSVGLARASYTESSTCCAALLALLAIRINTVQERLQAGCEAGMPLMRKMLLGIYSSNQEKEAVETLDAAVGRLRRFGESEPSARSAVTTYAQFKSWANGQRRGTLGASEHSTDDPTFNWDQGQTSVTLSHDLYEKPGLGQSVLDELSILPGINDWFDFEMS